MNKKGQSAIEFIILVGAVFFFFIAFSFAIQGNIADKTKEKRDLIINDIGLTVQDEVNLASQSSDGYLREFKVPPNLLGYEYDISIVDGWVYVRTTNGKHATAYPLAPVIGEIQKGTNRIRKESGQVYLNS